ncbi:Phosphoinositide phospholipase C 2 [Hibiscus syriacus]|uniref:Phosphoinositide phospholipase C n=1 Tax=Hibiscus syriacus TaxID=106335 RepID=A0A6A3D6G6_HIBSY|nr:Phosphoinositide phospholipase C 2 [Hibiscus syriacus]
MFFSKFLIQHQGEKNATREEAQAIFNSLKHLNIFHRRGLHLEAFFRYLLGDNNLVHPPSSQVHHDMNAPLSHYFLFTGHNSYLTGNQLSSSSSVEPIKDALLRGVRVIELDLWPNSKGTDVEVCHGGTLTSPVDLRKCLQAIKEIAFHASEYHVVITFEDHLKEKLQKMVVKSLSDLEHVLDEDEEKAVPQYRQLIAIHAGKLKGGLDNWLSDDPKKVRRLSLSEQELENAAKTHGTKIGHGKHLWIMQGMFKANGGCGYVKKPDFMLQRGLNDEVFDPSAPLEIKIVMRVKVILGEGWHQDFHHTAFDRYSPPYFYTRIGITGVPADKDVKQTSTIEDEWLPVWEEEFEFLIRVPGLAVLRIQVLEYDTTGRPDFGGQAGFPVPELRTGIRNVPLFDKNGNKYKHVRLLLSIKLERPYYL